MTKCMKNLISLLAIVIALSSCLMPRKSMRCANSRPNLSIKQALKWYTSAAEKTALYRQAYTSGEHYVQTWLNAHHPKEKSWGVILDIDETVLDNSWYFKECRDLTLNEAEFSHYISLKKESKALPGAEAFTYFVHAHGGYVTLISNRDGACCKKNSVMKATLQNLKEQNIYFDQVILANHESLDPNNKNPRFEAVIKGHCDLQKMICSNTLPAHEVIAYFGDNIQDFPNLFQKSIHASKNNDKIFDNFSKNYFIMPNPLYGSWQKNPE